MTGSALVTGATGFIGSALVRKLVARGIRTTCLVRAGSPCARLAAVEGATLVPFDFQDLSALPGALAGHRSDVVFNLAAYGVSQVDRDREPMFRLNLAFLARLLEAVADWKVSAFLQAGSCSEYGDGVGTERVGEDFPLRPTSLYGAAKAAAALYGGGLARALGIPFVTLRLFGVYGPGEGPQRFIPYLIRSLEEGVLADLTGGEQVRDFLYVEDAAQAFVEASVRPAGSTPAVYNVCTGVPTRIREIGEAVADALGKPRELLGWGLRPYREDEPMHLVGDNARFTSAFPWRPQVGLREGIRRTVEAWRTRSGSSGGACPARRTAAP